MGNKYSLADFCYGAKRFGKKSWKLFLVVIKVLALLVLIPVGLVISFILNLVVFLTSPVWMPVAFIFRPAWLARLIGKPASDNPFEAMFEGRLFTVKVLGGFYKWIGTRSLTPRKQRFAFMQAFSTDLKKYPVRVQVQYWEDCSYKENNFNCLTEKARVKILQKLISKRDETSIKSLLGAYTPKLKGEFVRSMLIAVRGIDEAPKLFMSEIISYFKPESFDVSMLTEDDIFDLWDMSSNMKKFVLLTKGMSSVFMKRLFCIEEAVEGEGVKILEAFIQKYTLKKEYMQMLLKEAQSKGSMLSLAKSIIVRDGLSQELLMLVYNTGNSQFIDEIVNAVELYTDKAMIKGLNPKVGQSDKSIAAENAERWAKYCSQRQISANAQIRMSMEQYKAFKASGQNLDDRVLKWMIVNVNDYEFFKLIVVEEFERLTYELRTLISAETWKNVILVDVTAAREEPIDLDLE